MAGWRVVVTACSPNHRRKVSSQSGGWVSNEWILQQLHGIDGFLVFVIDLIFSHNLSLH